MTCSDETLVMSMNPFGPLKTSLARHRYKKSDGFIYYTGYLMFCTMRFIYYTGYLRRNTGHKEYRTPIQFTRIQRTRKGVSSKFLSSELQNFEKVGLG
jgi:hypothetical protein